VDRDAISQLLADAHLRFWSASGGQSIREREPDAVRTEVVAVTGHLISMSGNATIHPSEDYWRDGFTETMLPVELLVCGVFEALLKESSDFFA